MASALGSDVVVDALPYIDQGYDDPGVRESALAMVDEECRRYRPTKNYLEHLPPLNLTSFETDVMRAEFERMQNRQPMEPLSMKRYELPPPPTGKLSDLQAWAECVDNSGAQLEHQATRVLNLELMLEYGQETWKSYLEILTSLLNKAQRELQFVRKEMQEINWKRKSLQTQGGEKLRALEAEWVALVSKNYEIEQACVQLEEAIGNELAVKEANTANMANKVNGLQNGQATTNEQKRKQTEDMFADDKDESSKQINEEANLPSNE